MGLEVESESMQREQEEEKKKRKERQRMFEDIRVVATMMIITLIACLVVLIKFIIIHTEVVRLIRSYFLGTSSLQVDRLSEQTFEPIQQLKDSKIKYTGNGYIPCDG